MTALFLDLPFKKCLSTVSDKSTESKEKMTIFGIVIAILGFGTLIFSMAHDFIADDKGLQHTFIGLVGVLFLFCGLVVLLFSAFRQKPWRKDE